MESFRYFHHVTSSSKDIIERKGLRAAEPAGRDHRRFFDGPIAGEDAPKGIWFSSTLYGGNLPTLSPYPLSSAAGEDNDRIAISVAPGSSWEDFTNPSKWHLYVVKYGKQRIVALVRSGDREKVGWFAKNNCQKLHQSEENKVLYFDGACWKCPSNQTCWTNIYVVVDRIDVSKIDSFDKKWGTCRKMSYERGYEYEY
eukprot:m.309615 g.309615  ORF g.309615 m.309615 type:complete len:198 (+) comp47094_c0_seq1:77-670(+)